MKEINSNHTCFNCSKNINWRSTIFNGSHTGVGRFSDSSDATIYYIDENAVEVVLTCPKCKNKNKFQYKL